MNNKKGFVNIVLIVLVVILAGAVGYFALVKKSPTSTSEIQPTNDIPSQQTPPVTTKNPPVTAPATPTLSADKKSVVADGKVLLAIDSDIIFNWFKTKSQLCDGYNLTSTPDRKMFCENKTSFNSKTRFSSIVVSPDRMKIGFTIESNTLTPDKVVGIFSRSANAVNLLGGYYLGNEFIGFSPNGTNFIYQGGCFEGMCGLYVKNSETLADKASLSDSEFADARTRTATFVRWISDNEVEYKLGSELKRASF
ncbi:MAG: hypothetical protein Q8L47_01960 [bacterium]|nr:hypothetical protein [bacterium]